MVQFTKATKRQAKLRMAIDGPAGSGKTYTALVAAMALKNGGRVALIDTERGSAAKYSDLFDFDTLDMREAYKRDTFDPRNYVDAIETAEAAGFDVLIIDSLSHAWEGEGGALEQVDRATTKGGNSYTAWKDVTPAHRKMVDAILGCNCHVIVTMRSKMEYVLVENERGKQVPKKVGMAPIQRQGMEYEFDIVADMDTDHNLIVSKSRCSVVADAVANKPSVKWFAPVKSWLSDGAPAVERKPEPIVHVTVGPSGERVETAETGATGDGHTDKPKLLRPYDPETLKKGLVSRIAKAPAMAVDPKLLGAMIGALEDLFSNDAKEIRTNKRHMVLQHITGKNSATMLSGPEIGVLLGWASERLDSGEYAPDEMAVQEAALIVKAMDADAGQTSLL